MKKFVLIVDDDEDLGSLLQIVLSKNGYDASHVRSISALRDTVGTVEPDIVFLDNRLDDGFGPDEIPMIKNLHPSCRIIVMTADDPYDIEAAGWVKSVDGWMGKPFSANDVQRHLAVTSHTNYKEAS